MTTQERANRPSDSEISAAYGTMLLGRGTDLNVAGWEPQETKYMNRPWKRKKVPK